MPKLYASKTAYVQQCMDLLEGNYTEESVAYAKVWKALFKLTKEELSSLYAMLLCEVKVKEV